MVGGERTGNFSVFTWFTGTLVVVVGVAVVEAFHHVERVAVGLHE